MNNRMGIQPVTCDQLGTRHKRANSDTVAPYVGKIVYATYESANVPKPHQHMEAVLKCHPAIPHGEFHSGYILVQFESE